MSRTKLTVPNTNLRRLMEERSIAPKVAAELLGLAPSTINGYLRLGELPVSVDLACTHLLPVPRAKAGVEHRIGVVRAKASDIENIDWLLNSVGAKAVWFDIKFDG